MADFKVNFEQMVNVFDPVYSSLRLNVTGNAEVSCADRSGDESDVRFVNMIIGDALMDECVRVVDAGTSFKDLVSKSDAICQGVGNALAVKDITLKSFSLTGVEPDALSKQGIELRDKMNAAKTMTAADYAKKIEEAQKAAQAKLDSMTPEERLKAQAEAQKAIAADAAARQKTMAQVKAIHDAVEKGAISGAEAGVQAFVPLKKFCPNCGAPRGNGRFCSKCGNKFN